MTAHHIGAQRRRRDDGIEAHAAAEVVEVAEALMALAHLAWAYSREPCKKCGGDLEVRLVSPPPNYRPYRAS